MCNLNNLCWYGQVFVWVTCHETRTKTYLDNSSEQSEAKRETAGKTMSIFVSRWILSLLLVAFCISQNHVSLAEPSVYNVGIGIADVTGPAAEVNMVSSYFSFRIFYCVHFHYSILAFIILFKEMIVVDVVNVAFKVEYLPLFSSKLTDFFF